MDGHTAGCTVPDGERKTAPSPSPADIGRCPMWIHRVLESKNYELIELVVLAKLCSTEKRENLPPQ